MLHILLWLIVVGGTAHILIGVVYVALAMGTPFLDDRLHTAWLSASLGILAAVVALGLLYWKVLRDVLVEILVDLGVLRK